MPKKLSFLAVALFLTVIAGGMLFLRSLITPSVAYNQNNLDLLSLTGDYDPADTTGEYYGQQVASMDNANAFAQAPTDTRVLGEMTNKRIEVDLTKQRLYAYEGDKLVYDFLISSGKFGKTPTGTFQIWGKFRYTKMEGGSKAKRTYYYLPNVPYVMFFSNDEIPAYRGFGIHGTYWHENFGVPMSHGCINMRTEEAGLIYNWANPDIGDKRSGRATEENPGTTVVIYGTAPGS